MWRSVLLLVDKHKSNKMEKEVFTTHDRIRVKFLEELVDSDARIDLGEWKTHVQDANPSGSKAATTAPQASTFRDFEQSNDPVVILEDAGYHVGDYVREKGIPDATLYMVVSLGHEVKLCEHNPHLASDPSIPIQKISINIDLLLQKWSIYEGKVSAELTEIEEATTSQMVLFDNARACVFHALLEHERAAADDRRFIYLVHPTGVAARDDIPKNGIKLAPLTLLANLSKDKRNTSIGVIGVTCDNDIKIYASAPPLQSKAPGAEVQETEKEKEKEKEFLMVPFWYVETTHDLATANVRLVSCKTAGITFPALQNLRKINAKERLRMFKPKEARVALDGAKVEGVPAPKRSKTA
jgi:hypothetical protein